MNAGSREFARTTAAVLLGLLLGVGSATYAGFAAFRAGGVSVGPWTANRNVGSSAASPWLRAAVALGGFLALDRRETVYFSAWTDDAGRTLSRRCSYRIEGPAPTARWWSITVYGSDGFLLPNAAHRYSFGGRGLADAETVRFDLAPRSDVNSVVPLGDGPADGSFSLTLRLYEPNPDIAARPERAVLPGIRRLACR